MRIREIILETATESRELQQVAAKIADHIAGQQGDTARFTARDIGVRGRETSIDNTLARLTFTVVNKPGVDEVAQYNHNTNSIEINWPRVEEEAEDKNLSTHAELTRTLVHELQHAVDGTKSQGQALRGTVASQSGDTEDDEFEQYLRLPHEVNARFAEALGDIADQLTHLREPAQLPAIIRDAFARREIVRAFPSGVNDPRYRRLMSRAYQYYANQMSDKTESSADQAARYILKK